MRVVEVVFGIFEFQELFEDGEVEFPTAGFVFGAFWGLGDETSDVSEAGGATVGDAVGRESVEELSQDVIDVDLGDVVASGAGQFGGEIVFALLGLVFGVASAEMGEAEAFPFGVGGEAAHAAIGKSELAKVEDIGWSRVRHREV